jgi:hypothetical protein
MKRTKTVQAVAVAILLLAAGAWAANKGNSTTVKIFDPVMVNGKALAPGEYKVTWEGSGPEVQVSFLQGKTVAATATAKIVPQDSANDRTATITRQDGKGLDLLEIRPQGKKEALRLGESGSTMGQP